MSNYQHLIESKVVTAHATGFDIDPATLHPSLFPHQRDIVAWNLHGGARAVFASFGLGKTRIAIETARQIIQREGGRALFITPLGVRQEFTRVEGPAMGCDIQYCRTMQEVETATTPYIITNYERIRIGDILPDAFTVISLVTPPLSEEQKEGIWDDILRMRTLNMNQALRKKEAHVCPLQLDLIERVIERYSNPGDTVFDPFGGIASVPYTAVKMNRYGIGTELNNDYWRDGCAYLREAEYSREVPTLFDIM